MACRAAIHQLGIALVVYMALTPWSVVAQSPPDPDFVRQTIFPSYVDFKNELLATVNIADPVERATELDDFWATLKNGGQVPYAQDNQVALLYRGAAGSVSWPGDFNGWTPSDSAWQGTQFSGTDSLDPGEIPSDRRSTRLQNRVERLQLDS